MRTSLTLRTLDGDDALVELAGEWPAIEASAGLAHPFLSLPWLFSWWEGFGAPGALRVVTARAGERLVGVLPLQASRAAVSDKLAFLPGKRWAMLQNGYSDRSAFLAARDTPGVLAALVEHLREAAGDWDFLDLRYVPEGELERLVDAFRGAGMELERFDGQPCYHLDLDGTWDGFLASRSAHFRKRLKENRIRLDKAGEHRIVRFGEELDDPDRALETFLDVDARSWRAESENTIGGDPQARVFYSALVRRFAAAGGLDLRFLELDGRPVAGILSVVYGRAIFGLKTAFDKDCRSLSPGTRLLRSLIEDSFARDLDRFDFIRGDDQLRRRWTETSSRFGRVVVFSPKAKGRLYSFLRKKAVPLAKRLLERGDLVEDAVQKGGSA